MNDTIRQDMDDVTSPNNSPNERPMWIEVVESDGGEAGILTNSG
jgi:hypothetical protein